MLRFLSHYTLLTYFSKLLRLRFLAHYILLTYFSKLLKVRFFNILHSVYLVSEAEIFNAIYVLLTYFSKLLKLKFLTQYIHHLLH